MPLVSLIHNERTKLSATALNALATAMITVGALAPLAAMVYGVSTPPRPLWQLLASAAIWVSIGGALHYAARDLLRRLKP